jgi:hypothetical protein
MPQLHKDKLVGQELVEILTSEVVPVIADTKLTAVTPMIWEVLVGTVLVVPEVLADTKMLDKME